MINIVIPMAGAGSRFAKAGYKKPKPFIDVLGKPMICHVLDNLNIPDAKFILLTRFEHYNNEQETVKWIKSNYKVEFVMIDKLTEGAACTVLHAHRLINNDTPLLIANSDQIVDMDISEYINDSKKRGLDGSVLCFEDNDKKWSYAKLDKNIGKYGRLGLKYLKHNHMDIYTILLMDDKLNEHLLEIEKEAKNK